MARPVWLVLSRAAVGGVILAGVIAFAGGVPIPAAGAAAVRSQSAPVPFQFIAKAYTELLGRAPTPKEWDIGAAWFRARGCSRASLERFGKTLIDSPEYRSDYSSSPPAEALTLFRFVLDREPGRAGFVAVRDRLGSGVPPVKMAESLFDSAEFAHRTEPAICSATNPSYYFGQPGHWTAYPAIPTPARDWPGGDVPEAPLQAALVRLSQDGGGTYLLAPREVVGLSVPLDIPAGVTLSTAGDPDPNRYADMARLVRLADFHPATPGADEELVAVTGGSGLEHVWVDGQRDSPNDEQFAMFNVIMGPGLGTTVSDDRLGNPEGATNLQDDGASLSDPPGPPCRDNVVSDNLVEAYSSHHTPLPGAPPLNHPQADGLGIYCEGATVEGNQIVDISDSGIVLFDGVPLLGVAAPQLSQVLDNTVVSAGNSYSFGIVTDPGYVLGRGRVAGGDPAGTNSRWFRVGATTARIVGNTLWTGDRTHINVVLNDGTHDLFGSTAHQNCYLPNDADRATCGGGRNALGAVWTDNTSAGIGVQTEMGIYVGGADGSVFAGDDLGPVTEVPGSGRCPRHPVVLASGNGSTTDFAQDVHIDPPVYHDTALASDSCITTTF